MICSLTEHLHVTLRIDCKATKAEAYNMLLLNSMRDVHVATDDITWPHYF
jgi:hypothetical protein